MSAIDTPATPESATAEPAAAPSPRVPPTLGRGLAVGHLCTRFVAGSGLYLIRRVSGLLVVGMIIHGLWDFSTFLSAGRGTDVVGAVPDNLAAVPFVWGTMLLTVVVLIRVFRRHKPAAAPAA